MLPHFARLPEQTKQEIVGWYFNELEAALAGPLEDDITGGIENLPDLKEKAFLVQGYFAQNASLDVTRFIERCSRSDAQCRARAEEFKQFVVKATARIALDELLRCDIHDLPAANSPSIDKVKNILSSVNLDEKALFPRGVFNDEEIQERYEAATAKSDRIKLVLRARNSLVLTVAPHTDDEQRVEKYEPELRASVEAAGVSLSALIPEKGLLPDVIERIIEHSLKMAHIRLARQSWKDIKHAQTPAKLAQVREATLALLAKAGADTDALDPKTTVIYEQDDLSHLITGRPEIPKWTEREADLKRGQILAEVPSVNVREAEVHGRHAQLELKQAQDKYSAIMRTNPVPEWSIVQNMAHLYDIKQQFWYYVGRAGARPSLVAGAVHKGNDIAALEEIDRQLERLDVRFAEFGVNQFIEQGFPVSKAGYQMLCMIADIVAPQEVPNSRNKRVSLVQPDYPPLVHLRARACELNTALAMADTHDLRSRLCDDPDSVNDKELLLLSNLCTEPLMRINMAHRDEPKPDIYQLQSVAKQLQTGWKEAILRTRYGIDNESRAAGMAKSA